MEKPDLVTRTEQGVKRSRESWFQKVVNLFNRPRIEEDTWEELEEVLISADVGITTTGKLIQNVKQRVKTEKLTESSQIRFALKEEMAKMLSFAVNDNKTKNENSFQIILVVGVNGSGKTTSIAKLANVLNQAGNQVILAAADTFRAAAIDQIKLWGERVNVPVIAHQSGGDPGAVVFDAVQAAKNRNANIVIVDTAGRLHTKFNLMEELKKIKRVASKYDVPQRVILVIDATTGQNGLLQAKHFTEAVGVTDIFLTKLDGTARGGIIFSICDELKIPIVYIGVGEKVDDIIPFDARVFVDAIFAN